MKKPSPPHQSKQSLFLTALHKKLQEIDNPDPDIITHDSYQYHEINLKSMGIIPKITFKPYGKSTQIKAEIMHQANLYDESRQREIDEIRKKFGLKTARDTETRILSRLFESYWNGYWRSIKTALTRIEQAQKLFITNTEKGETISKPMRILMGNVVPNNRGKVVPNEENQDEKNIQKKSYTDELMEVD